MDLSIIIPLYNEAESLGELSERISEALRGHVSDYEIIFIDDGSTDSSWQVIQQLRSDSSNIHGIRFRRNYGKSAALFCGFEAAQGDIVVTMDADLQDDPSELPEMMRMIREDGCDLVSGWKKKRYDNRLTKNIPSKIYNWAARRVTGIKLHDMNCGLKAYRNEVVKSIEVYGEMHRFIPYLAKNAGYDRIAEKVVKHQARKYGTSKFGMERFMNGFLDLVTIAFLQKFGRKPMHLFGVVGTLMFLAGFICAVWLIVEKLIRQSHGMVFRQVADQPLFYAAIVCLMIGIMLFLTGFVAELISRNSAGRNTYNVKDRI
ncbi:MAG: glycosyltransferase family 2 protein [Bacteroidales bacterium]|nr:glycosyltransferase family 2 protein [Bacteroidales bacterium]